jgi:type VI secretion system protein ImpG
VGFECDEVLFDVAPRSFPGYQLLSDFFVFPEKFLFFDLLGLDRRALGKLQAQHAISIFIFLDRHQEDLERFVSTETFQTGCCPVINLYRQRTEPIRLTHTETEYRVVPDARRPLMHEVHSIDRVTALSSQNEQLEFSPFYSLKHERSSTNEGRFWHATRRPGETVGGLVDEGTDVYLSLVDLQFDPTVAGEWTLDITATCLNRDLPSRLPFGGGQPYLQLSEGGPLQRISCLTAPTRTLRPAWGYGLLWRLISHLSLNHLSLYSPDGDPDALREILRLYDVRDSDETRGMIQGLQSVRARRITGRPGGSIAGGFARGLEVTLEFDEKKFTGNSVYLMAAVLERFLAMYSSINSFTQTTVKTARREER